MIETKMTTIGQICRQLMCVTFELVMAVTVLLDSAGVFLLKLELQVLLRLVVYIFSGHHQGMKFWPL